MRAGRTLGLRSCASSECQMKCNIAFALVLGREYPLAKLASLCIQKVKNRNNHVQRLRRATSERRGIIPLASLPSSRSSSGERY